MPSRRQQRQQMLKDEDSSVENDKAGGEKKEEDSSPTVIIPDTVVEEKPKESDKVDIDKKNPDVETVKVATFGDSQEPIAKVPKEAETVDLDNTPYEKTVKVATKGEEQVPIYKKTTAREDVPVVKEDAEDQTVKVASFGNEQKPVAEAYKPPAIETSNLQKEWLIFLTFLGAKEASRVMSGNNWKYKLRQAIGDVEF